MTPFKLEKNRPKVPCELHTEQTALNDHHQEAVFVIAGPPIALMLSGNLNLACLKLCAAYELSVTEHSEYLEQDVFEDRIIARPMSHHRR